ncbi:MAG TPA: chemotaxis protein CheB [Anseongella sp.]|nr:chemotaxis protein CheB [Anseongella sp.]
MKGVPIVAIGFSAGGLNPLKDFFDSTLHDKVSYVILQHLPLEYKSRLKDILKRHSKLQIIEVEEGMAVDPNKVYVLPRKQFMVIKEGVFQLIERDKGVFPNRAVDIFMESLAGLGNCMAVILSGSGDDGTKGISSIKKGGGIVIAQTPDSCEHSSMPENAIKSGNVDHVMLPSEMPGIIQQYVKQAGRE